MDSVFFLYFLIDNTSNRKPFGSNVWGVYFVVLSTAFIWMTVMEWRILVKKDVRINQLFVLANAPWLILIEI